MNVFASLAEPLRCRPGDVLPAAPKKPRGKNIERERSAVPPSEHTAYPYAAKPRRVYEALSSEHA